MLYVRCVTNIMSPVRTQTDWSTSMQSEGQCKSFKKWKEHWSVIHFQRGSGSQWKGDCVVQEERSDLNGKESSSQRHKRKCSWQMDGSLWPIPSVVILWHYLCDKTRSCHRALHKCHVYSLRLLVLALSFPWARQLLRLYRWALKNARRHTFKILPSRCS